jgi:hypothetical protein
MPARALCVSVRSMTLPPRSCQPPPDKRKEVPLASPKSASMRTSSLYCLNATPQSLSLSPRATSMRDPP